MRHWFALGIALLAGVSIASAAESAAYDWDVWRNLPVLDNGRHKPFDTLASETARTLGNPSGLTDPKTGEKLNPVALYLSMLFQWEGEPKTPAHHMSAPNAYFAVHKADEWDKIPLLYVGNRELREALEMPAGEKYISPLTLSDATFHDPQTGKEFPFILQVRKLQAHKLQRMSPLDRKTTALADALWVYQQARMGEMLIVIPMQNAQGEDWISVKELIKAKFDDTSDPKGLIRKAQEQFMQVRTAFRERNAGVFNTASSSFAATVRQIGEATPEYPTQKVISLEIAYNHWAPFRFAWMFCSLTFMLSLMGIISGRQFFCRMAMMFFIACLSAILVGFTMRTLISGRAPVTNMYESVMYLGLGTVIFGLIFELFSKKGLIISAAAAISTIALVLADNSPVVLDPSLKPLAPVLRSNYWLVIHVMTITLSYASFALALGIGDVTLGFYFFRSKNHEAIASLTKFTYRTLQASVLLLIIGTLLGALWAEDSWGRFWGWDPKEVWALITLLVYCAVLHARYLHWVGPLGLAAWSVVCYTCIIMAWYGVNFWLGTGLHSYGSGAGGQVYVVAAIFVQFAYVAAAVFVTSLNPHTVDKSSALPA
jgi:ABC-type transport system involved in cytochrome c biogenesis permease subunit